MDIKGFLGKVFTGRTPWFYIYVFLVPFVNWTFSPTSPVHVPSVPMPDGGFWAPVSVLTGLILVVRDFAQREVDHFIFAGLATGVAISFAMSPPNIALASALAFAISELVDWALYSFSKRPLSERVMLSSILAAPLDTTLFWYLASFSNPGVFSPLTLITSAGSKLLGAYVVYLILKNREKKAAGLSL